MCFKSQVTVLQLPVAGVAKTGRRGFKSLATLLPARAAVLPWANESANTSRMCFKSQASVLPAGMTVLPVGAAVLPVVLPWANGGAPIGGRWYYKEDAHVLQGEAAVLSTGVYALPARSLVGLLL
jgi:hypothetical protein